MKTLKTSTIFVLLSLVMPLVSSSQEKDLNVYIMAVEGGLLTEDEALRLEGKVIEGSLCEPERIKLLGFYFLKSCNNPSFKRAQEKHIIWLIQNDPESKILSLPYGRISPVVNKEGYFSGKIAWLKQIEEEKSNVIFLQSAAGFFFPYDLDLAIELLERAILMSPNNQKITQKLMEYKKAKKRIR